MGSNTPRFGHERSFLSRVFSATHRTSAKEKQQLGKAVFQLRVRGVIPAVAVFDPHVLEAGRSLGQRRMERWSINFFTFPAQS